MESVNSQRETPPWYQDCTMTSRPLTGTSEPLWATQFSVLFCSRGILKYDLKVSSFVPWTGA